MAGAASSSSSRRAGSRGSEYRKRWLKEHPPVVIYLSKEDYEYLKSVADSENRSYGSIVSELLRKRREYESRLVELQRKEEELKNRLSELEQMKSQAQEMMELARKMLERSEKIAEEAKNLESKTIQNILKVIEELGERYIEAFAVDNADLDILCRVYASGSIERQICAKVGMLLSYVIKESARRGLLWVVPEKYRGRRFRILIE